jgi:hypothetical protein
MDRAVVGRAAPAIAIGALDAPGARFPVSSVPSLSTTRWMIVSTLCHTILWPEGSVAGFGENDCAPFIATTSTVTTPEALGGVGFAGLPLCPVE